MKLLVIGRTGQVARELARALPQGTTASFLGRQELDLSRPDQAAAAVAATDADAVINAAAWTAVDRAEAEEDAARAVNADAPAAMAEAAARKGLPFLHVSTDYVFDGTGTQPFRPDDPTGPLGAYGRTKLAGEQGVRAAGGPHLILRTSWVVSAHGANFVKTMLRLGRERPVLRVVADQVGGPTPAADIAAALLAAAQAMAQGTPGGTHHFAGSPDVSWADFARAILAAAGLPAQVEDITTADYPTPARRPANSRLDCTAFTAAFGVPRPDWRPGLHSILKELDA
ncbi:dTDP-4-dehydrorhamnose reductase [Rhodobacter sp. Har01]|uniref:dTDP-4-dehydrorhamnose reductase n=1 Tax=Rhodobacter sp. Har01 TaxID=2883999 RepID=UPI001D073939|nr:dTDP-4-dehydrorhamnose reductase [Rhodobacter sp. Har01]MCB6178380.1 dTDP-4-dehydrorhamnose reductase [Rhodobacter sp. Har01]